MNQNQMDNLKKFKTYEQVVLMCSRASLEDNEKLYVKELIDRYDMDWCAFLGTTLFNRVGGTVYRNILEIGGFPSRITNSLRVSFEGIKERTVLHQAEIRKIDKIFEEENIRFAFLKGAVLNTVFYNVGERMSNDTDILIDVKDINKCTKILESLGYVQGEIENNKIIPATKKEIIFARLNTYETVPFAKEMHNVNFPIHEIDINFRLGNDDYGEYATEMLEQSIRVEYNNTSLRTLNNEYFFIFLCIHHYREATMIHKIVQGDDLTLYKYMDIHTYVKKAEIDWEKVVLLSKHMGKQKDVYHTLYYTEILYPGTIKSEVFDLFDLEDLSFINQYKGKDNSDEVYEWKLDIYSRFFNNDRIIEALENIEEENARFNEIKKKLREKP